MGWDWFVVVIVVVVVVVVLWLIIMGMVFGEFCDVIYLSLVFDDDEGVRFGVRLVGGI